LFIFFPIPTPLSLLAFVLSLKMEAQVSTECPICCETYTIEGEHIPLLLPCGHSMCQKCISLLPAPTSSTSTSSSPDQQPQTPPLCPICRTPIRRRLDDQQVKIERNTVILELMEQQKEIAEQQDANQNEGATVMCVDCNAVAAVYCQACDAYLCDKCFADAHNRKVGLSLFHCHFLTIINLFFNAIAAAALFVI
jgi:hypothetical protein